VLYVTENCYAPVWAVTTFGDPVVARPLSIPPGVTLPDIDMSRDVETVEAGPMAPS